MNKHTPGPWTYEGTGCQIGGPDRVLIADTFGLERAPETRQANARLIAAAPDLLAALERVAGASGPFNDSHSPYWTINEDDMKAARAAIARARGEG